MCVCIYIYILGSLWGSFFIRVPYDIGDLKGDPNVETYVFFSLLGLLLILFTLIAVSCFSMIYI